MKLLNGNCLDELKKIEDNSIDAVVTDPPYGLKFMGKQWDYDVPSVEIWKEVSRVLKPGGHLLSFGGTRTYHRMAVNIEDAGFEIRDQIQWIYGSGFPKSHNLKDQWEGSGTALKPANEPICLARKPLEKGLTIAQNVLKWRTGAINVDECRIAHNEKCKMMKAQTDDEVMTGHGKYGQAGRRKDVLELKPQGRWPANVLLDEESAELLDQQSWPAWSNNVGASRFFYCAKASKSERNAGLEGMPLKESGIKNDSGRGFSESDPYKKIFNQNHHPTVKPIKLMQYLIKLITLPNGTVLDPFMGSGSTGVAAKQLGFKFVGIEIDSSYFELANKRILKTDEQSSND